jgi:signal transduction histidine kinase
MTSSLFQADQRWHRLRSLTEVNRALTYTTSLQAVLDLTVKRAAELLEADKAVLLLANEDGLLSVCASHGVEPEVCERFREPLHETLITRLEGLLGEGAKERFIGVPLVVGGDVTGLLAVARPPTNRSSEDEEWLLSALADQAAVALQKTRLDETAEFRERVIGIVSHDLRDPISAILMAAEVLLRRSELDDATTKTVLRIRSSAKRATRLIEDLLDFTQARLGGGIRIQPRAADVHQIARHVVEELEIAHPDRTIALATSGDGLGTWDPDRLAQVLANLIVNAVHYSPTETEVRVTTSGEPDGAVRIVVHNAGNPIPPERLSQIFEPMKRGTSELPHNARTVGLGLYIVKHIVEAHRGEVSVESTAEAGTTFTVRLPRG